MTGAERIAAERQRQISEENYDQAHDRTHQSGELVTAAICYATLPGERKMLGGVPEAWPWEDISWNPSDDRRRDLTKAGALIAAEIDRIDAEIDRIE